MAFGIICIILSVVCIFAGVHAHKDNDKRRKGFFIVGDTFLSGAIGSLFFFFLSVLHVFTKRTKLDGWIQVLQKKRNLKQPHQHLSLNKLRFTNYRKRSFYGT